MKLKILFSDFTAMCLDVSLNDLSTFISERYDIRIPFKFEIRWRTDLFGGAYACSNKVFDLDNYSSQLTNNHILGFGKKSFYLFHALTIIITLIFRRGQRVHPRRPGVP